MVRVKTQLLYQNRLILTYDLSSVSQDVNYAAVSEVDHIYELKIGIDKHVIVADNCKCIMY